MERSNHPLKAALCESRAAPARAPPARTPATCLDRAQLYADFWQFFDKETDYWRTKIGTGHAARPRVDTFLQNWLTRRTGEAVLVNHLYAQFVEHVAPKQLASGDTPLQPCDVPELMADIRADSSRFRIIEAAFGPTRFATFLRRLKAMVWWCSTRC